MRILFATSSIPRHYSLSIKSLQKYVFSRLPDFDIVAHFSLKGDINKEQISEAYYALNRNCQITFCEDPPLPDRWLEMNSNIDPSSLTSGVGGILYQWLSLKNCLQMINQIEQQRGVYDWIIWSRPDLFYYTHIEDLIKLPCDALYFPAHDNWSGFNDRFCFGPSDLMKARMQVLDYFVKEWYPTYSSNTVWNPERVLLDLLTKNKSIKFRRSRISFGKIREDHVSKPYWNKSALQELGWRIPLLSLFKTRFLTAKRYPLQNLDGFDLEIAKKVFLL